MKKIVAMSIIATGMLFASDIRLGVVQANTIVGAAAATNGSKIKQGEVGVFGESNVRGLGGILPAAVASVNSMGILVTADGNSTIEQGTVTISDSDVIMNKVEGNTIAGFVTAKDGSSISQGKWKIVDVGDASVNSLLQVNSIVLGAKATDNSKIAQGSISIGSVDHAFVTATGLNTMLGGVLAAGGAEVAQGNIVICGNTHLELCGTD